MRTVNTQEIAQLYEFTKAHFVEFYDLQTELVDHLANTIESIWETKPQFTFEQARDASFKKFGVFGFMEVVEQRQKVMQKRYLKFLLKELQVWFSLPKLLVTSVLFIAFYLAFSSVIAKHFSIVFYALLIVFGIYKGSILRKQYRLRQKQSHKKWLLEEYIFKQTGVIVLFLITQQYTVRYFLDASFNSVYANMGMALLFTFLYLIVYVAFELLPNKAEALLQQTYPEFSL